MTINTTNLINSRVAAGYATATLGAKASHVGVPYNARREAGTNQNASRLVIRRWAKTYHTTVAHLLH